MDLDRFTHHKLDRIMYIVSGRIEYKAGSMGTNHRFTESCSANVLRKILAYRDNSGSMITEASDVRDKEIFVKLENRKCIVWFYAFPIENDEPRLTYKDLLVSFGLRDSS